MDSKVKVGHIKMVRETLAVIIPMAWNFRKGYFLLYLVHILGKSVQPFVNIILPKFIIDQLCGERNIEKLILYVGITIGANIFLTVLLMYTDEFIRKTYNPGFSKYTSSLIARECMGMKFEHTENKKVLEQTEKAFAGMEWYSGGIGGVVGSLADILLSILQLIGTLTIIFIGSPLLIVVLIVSVLISALFQWKASMIQVKNFAQLSGLNRCFGYYLFQLLNFQYGKDIRLYDASDMMVNKADSLNNEMTMAWKKQSEDTYRFTAVNDVVGVLRDVFFYSFLGIQAFRKIISLGEFTMLTTASITFTQSLFNVIQGFQQLFQKSIYVYEFVKFMRMGEEEEQGKSYEDIAPILIRKDHIVELRGVSFSYPNTDNVVLDKIDLTIHSGEHLAVVGLNGSGKTTLIKLLCRLYSVTEGAIYLDGVNIERFRYEEYIKMIGVVFQDFKLLAFSVKENIVLDGEDSQADAVEKIIDFVGLHEKMEGLKEGIDSHIYRYFDDDGFEPSGGEAQKIAIGRAIYKDAPILILDEPTAALDPMAEFEIYRQFHEIVGGKTALYISHRLSSCQFCDRIIVLSQGKITEEGNHEELLVRQGLYNKMFQAQAQYYV